MTVTLSKSLNNKGMGHSLKRRLFTAAAVWTVLFLLLEKKRFRCSIVGVMPVSVLPRFLFSVSFFSVRSGERTFRFAVFTGVFRFSDYFVVV